MSELIVVYSIGYCVVLAWFGYCFKGTEACKKGSSAYSACLVYIILSFVWPALILSMIYIAAKLEVDNNE